MKKELESVINSIVSAASKENLDLFLALSSNKSIDKAVENVKRCDGGDFYFGLTRPIEKVVDGLLSTVTENRSAKFILKHYMFVEGHILTLIKQHEGNACSADKSRTIVRKALNFYINGKEIEFDYNAEYTYHLPKKIFKTHDEIVSFIDALNSLYHGRSILYIKYLADTIAIKDDT